VDLLGWLLLADSGLLGLMMLARPLRGGGFERVSLPRHVRGFLFARQFFWFCFAVVLELAIVNLGALV